LTFSGSLSEGFTIIKPFRSSMSLGAVVNNTALMVDGGDSALPFVIGDITGNGTLTIGNGITGAAYVQIAKGSTVMTCAQSYLTINTGSTLDITVNLFDLNYQAAGMTTPFSAIQGGIDGDITQYGQIITSEPVTGYGMGYYDTAGPGITDAAVRFGRTLIGDVNVDGTVNLTDLLDLLNYYGQVGQGWNNGDTNGDGAVNLTDLLSLLNNYKETDSATAVYIDTTVTFILSINDNGYGVYTPGAFAIYAIV
jgi:hypothetical protein